MFNIITMSDENLQKNLIALFKLFKTRPYHLSKYLLDNLAFNSDFLEKIKNSEKLSGISDNELPSFFQNISQMEDFYNSLLEESTQPVKSSKEDLSKELNNRLNQLIDKEKYEEAAALRDYMMLKGIKKI